MAEELATNKNLVQAAIVDRLPGETLTFRIDRLDPQSLIFSEIEVDVTLREHPNRDGPFLGIEFRTALFRPEFSVLEGTVSEAELNTYMYSTAEVGKLFAVAPGRRSAFDVSAGTTIPLSEYVDIQNEYVRFVETIGGEVMGVDLVTIAGTEALRILARQPTLSSELTEVTFHALRTGSKLFTLQFFGADPSTDGPSSLTSSRASSWSTRGASETGSDRPTTCSLQYDGGNRAKWGARGALHPKSSHAGPNPPPEDERLSGSAGKRRR